VTVVAGVSGTNLLIDINGYFSSSPANPANYLQVINTAPGSPAALFGNLSNADSSTGVFGTAGPNFLRPVYAAAGVRGEGRAGVLGISREVGVFGSVVSAEDGAEQAFGVLGSNDSVNVAGVYGQSVYSGVVGAKGVGPLSFFTTGAGVLGVSKGGGWGVEGYGPHGVGGRFFSPPGTFGAAAGYLGYSATIGVYSNGDAHIAGTFTATNNKGFVQPHPHDASKEIRYISLEGPHTEVYFRGTAQVSQGVTRIPIPEHFRFVADPGTYSTLVTPVGEMATVAVVSEGAEGIVVRASRNVKVHYVVFAEREAVRNPDPIIENEHFRPDPDLEFLAYLPGSFRELMIRNGTLNSDGTVNMETARRLGWDKRWEKQSRPAPQPTEP
jgi:hypothetical protein